MKSKTSNFLLIAIALHSCKHAAQEGSATKDITLSRPEHFENLALYSELANNGAPVVKLRSCDEQVPASRTCSTTEPEKTMALPVYADELGTKTQDENLIREILLQLRDATPKDVTSEFPQANIAFAPYGISVTVPTPDPADIKAKALELCGTMNDLYKKSCIAVVGRARFYDPALIEQCKTLSYQFTKVYCLDRGRNSKFKTAALNACFSQQRGWIGDPDIIECAARVAEVDVVDSKSRLVPVTATNYNNYQRLYIDVENLARNTCSGWDKYHFEKVNWKQADVWTQGGLAHCKTFVYCTTKRRDNYATVKFAGDVQ